MTQNTTNMNIETATEIAKSISKDKGQDSEVRKVARKFLRESKVRREKILGRWTIAMAEVLGFGEITDCEGGLMNLEEITVNDIQSYLESGPKEEEKPKAKKAAKKTAVKKTAPKKTAVKKTAPKKAAKSTSYEAARDDAEMAATRADAAATVAGDSHIRPDAAKSKPAATAHIPIAAKEVEEAIEQAEGKHLGDLCGWSLAGTRKQAEVIAAATKFGIEDDLAFPRTTPNSCYRKAVSIVFTVGKADTSGKPMARIVEDSADKLVHAIVTSKVVDDDDDKVSAKDVSFETEIKVGFDKLAYREGASPEGCLIVEDPAHPAAVDLKAKYLELAYTYLTNDIRSAFQTAFKTWAACPVLPHGGLWYIPAINADKVRAWNGFMNEIRMTTVVIPAFDTKETIESLRAATRNGLEGQLADLLNLMEYYATNGWADVRKSTLEKRMEDFDNLRAQADLYKGILGTTIDDLTEKLATCATRVMQDLTKREGEEEEKAAQQEKEKAERKAEKVTEREERRAAERTAKDALRAAKTSEKPAETRKGRKAEAGRKSAETRKGRKAEAVKISA